MLVAYVSGHGFGHATRVSEVLRALRERDPALPLTVVTSAPEALYRRAIPGPFLFRSLECDVGLVQKDALVIDEPATLERWRAFDVGYPALVRGEADWLRESEARLVLGDVPPLAFDAAAGAGIPSVALANFSWDWIYRHLSRRHTGLAAAAEASAASYGRAKLLLRLPFAGDLSVFPRIVDIPLVARCPRVSRVEARARLGLSGTTVLLSFGGLGLPGFDPACLAAMPELQFVMPPTDRPVPGNTRVIGGRELDEHGLGYAELVGAADVVVSKPGYGIVSDAIGARTPLVYTERGDFPEYPILVREMAGLLPCAHVSNETLLAGRLREPIRRVLEAAFPEPPDLGGAERAAEQLLELVESSRVPSRDPATPGPSSRTS